VTETSDVKGFVAPGFERVAETLGAGATLTLSGRERRADLGDGGGAFCAFADGECLVDVWTGLAAPDGRAWEKDTRAVIMSSTKGMTTLCAHILEDRGELDLDALVTRYWPEFGQAGKSATTVRQLLSHQSGAIGVPDADRLLSWDGSGWKDSDVIAADIAGGEPAWESGTRHGYHGVTFGWLVGELVRRVSGQSLGTFFGRRWRVRSGWPAPSGPAPRSSSRWRRSWSSP
jgi:CubicO group peptidase (beta-lactamase class C family)